MSRDRQSRMASPDNDESSHVPPNLSDLKMELGDGSTSANHEPHSGEHRRPRDSGDDLSELQGGEGACFHARGIELELSDQNASCDCEGAMTRARKRRLSDSPMSDWQLVHVIVSPDHESSRSANCSRLGIVLPANYLRFAQNFGQDFGTSPANSCGRSVVVVGLLCSGRIIITRAACLLKATATLEFDVVAFADMTLRACSECHSCSHVDAAEETAARDFVSKMQVGGALACPTFESIFDRICAVCFNHQVEENPRSSFLRALHCICSFSSFQARFVTKRGQLALVSLMQSCQSCLCAELVLNCVNAMSENKTIAAKVICPELVEALFSLVEAHNSAAAKACAVLEQW